ncbi:hypothetical protein AALP_AA2G200800 [Arabis alpina]|uniref:Uncharacterized protein n=1 Tax=Arabis alpina TaxID=50452 RepID=A0A087HIQ7_ARAAL|nr:hypothetical protein AALP_AA2G200800 [Arabis alpina]
MLKKNKKQSTTTMEDHHGSFRYRNGEDFFFDKIDYEVSSVLLELSHLVVFSSLLPKWGRTQKRSSSGFYKPPEISPVVKSPPCMEVGEMGSTSSSSCLTGEAKKTNPQSSETGLSRAQVGQYLQPLICVDRTVNMRGIETASLLRQGRDNLERRSFDLNIPAAEEGGGNNSIDTIGGLQRMVTKVQAAQARQRRLGLIRSKKFYNRFISPYQ